MPGEDFIEIHPAALSRDFCRHVIKRANATASWSRGAVGGGVHVELKNSWDIDISQNAEWQDVERELGTAVLVGLEKYARRYPYVILAPLTVQGVDETGALRRLTDGDLCQLSSEKLRSLLVRSFRPGPVLLQRYVADEGGYPYWHSEIFPRSDGEALRRVLFWTAYLNDDFDGGETEFFHQKRLVEPVAGNLLFAPAGFTHTHRGNRPLGGDKLIATSWIFFRE